MGVFKSVAVANISTSVAHERGVSILLCRIYWSMVCESGRTLRNTCGFWRRYLTIAIRTLVCSSWSPETIWLAVLKKQLPSPRIRVVFCGSWCMVSGFKWLYSKLAACCHCAPNVCGGCLCFRSNEKTIPVMSPMLVTRVAMSASHPVNATMILPYYHTPRARAPCPRPR